MSQDQINILKRALGREKAARKIAEKILDEKSRDLYFLSEELKQTNLKLKNLLNEKSTQLQGVFENINDAYVIIDFYGNVLKMNDVAKDMFGYNIEKEKFNVVDLLFEKDRKYSFKSFDKLKTEGDFNNFISRVITKSNKVKWVQINASLIFDKDKNAVAAQGIIRDITSEREKKQIIELVSNLTKSILGITNINEIAYKIIHNIINFLETKDCVIYLVNHNNQTLEQIAAYGQKLDKDQNIKNKLVIPIGEGIVGTVVKTGVSEIIHDTSKDKRYIIDDATRLSEITVPIIIDGQVIGIIDSEHEDKNHYTSKHLEVLESIANLVAIKLRSAISIRERKKIEIKNAHLLSELEKSNDELQEYAHIVSHDLKTPLRSINALVYWIKSDNKDSFDEATNENFKLIELTLEKMEQLISNVLEYSASDSKNEEIIAVDLNLIIREIQLILYIPENITLEVKKKLPTIKGHKTKVQQLFLNLISNGVKFSDKEKGIIEIDFIDKKTEYQFSVKDNGIGIEKKFHDKIFKIFHYLNKNKDSSGIGLSIVKKIVNLYGGTLWIESEPGVGSNFYFTIKK